MSEEKERFNKWHKDHLFCEESIKDVINYVSKLESEKNELLEFIKNYMQCVSSFNVKGNIEKLYKDGFDILKKHGVEI